ncbi:hypothetical protein PG990_005058 [Apiospora arundinis]
MSGGHKLRTLFTDGHLNSQTVAAGNSSRASTEDADRPSIAGFSDEDPDSQASKWHNNDISSPGSALAGFNANRANRQHHTEQAQQQESSDAQEDRASSEELLYSDDIGDPMSEESPKSFGEEDYVPSQQSTGTNPQVPKRAPRAPPRGSKRNAVRTQNARIPKGWANSPGNIDKGEPGIEQATQVSKSNTTRGKSQKAAQPRFVGASSLHHSTDDSPPTQQGEVEQGKRSLPFKKRVAKKPFEEGNNESGSMASSSKVHATTSTSTKARASVKHKHTAEVRDSDDLEEAEAAKTNDPFDIEGSPEPDSQHTVTDGRSRKRPNPRAKLPSAAKSAQQPKAALGSGSSAEKSPKRQTGLQGPAVSPDTAAAKPNSKKRRISPQGYGSRSMKQQGSMTEFPFSNGRGTATHSGPKSRSNTKQSLLDPVTISSDLPSTDSYDEDLQPGYVQSPGPPARQQQGHQSIDEPSMANTFHPLNKKGKTVEASSYKERLIHTDQRDGPSNSDNGHFIGNPDDEFVEHEPEPEPEPSRGVGLTHKTRDNNEGIVVWKRQSPVPKGKNADFTPAIENNLDMDYIPQPGVMVSSDPFTGPRNLEKDKVATKQFKMPRVTSQKISLDSPPQESDTVIAVQPDMFTRNHAANDRLNPWNSQPAPTQPKKKPSSYSPPTRAQETRQYYGKPLEPRRQQQRNTSFVRNVQPRYPQSSPEHDLSTQLNAKTQEYVQLFAPLQPIRHDILQARPFKTSMPQRGSPFDSNVAPVESIPLKNSDQYGYQGGHEYHIHGNDAIDVQERQLTENQRSRSGHLVHQASGGISEMLHEIVTVIHRQLASKEDIMDNVINEYDRGGKKITTTLLKRQQDEFKPTISKFHGNFQDMSKIVARSAQGIEEGTKATVKKVEAFSKNHQKRKHHMLEVRETIRTKLTDSAQG